MTFWMSATVRKLCALAHCPKQPESLEPEGGGREEPTLLPEFPLPPQDAKASAMAPTSVPATSLLPDMLPSRIAGAALGWGWCGGVRPTGPTATRDYPVSGAHHRCREPPHGGKKVLLRAAARSYRNRGPRLDSRKP